MKFFVTNQKLMLEISTMKPQLIAASTLLSALMFLSSPVSAQTAAPPVMSTPPATLEEKEAMYNKVVEERTLKIMEALAMTDSVKSNRVHDAIVAHYHALRARDEAIDAELITLPAGSQQWLALRIAMFPRMSQPLHEQFIANLSRDLTPKQIEVVKDEMTYGKVEFTYNAYCSILPNLTDAEKARVLELLKQAREVAMDGGSSGQKTAIFQQYKDQINAYLDSHGYNVAEATKEWTAKQEQAGKQTTEPGPATNSPAQ
jgi:Protein of unknown function (DUF3826)